MVEATGDDQLALGCLMLDITMLSSVTLRRVSVSFAVTGIEMIYRSNPFHHRCFRKDGLLFDGSAYMGYFPIVLGCVIWVQRKAIPL
jgi:hypothetical protein